MTSSATKGLELIFEELEKIEKTNTKYRIIGGGVMLGVILLYTLFAPYPFDKFYVSYAMIIYAVITVHASIAHDLAIRRRVRSAITNVINKLDNET